MSKRVFLFHWNADECADLASDLERYDWTVDTEAEDGARGSAAVIADPPDAVLISLRRLPSHGRATAEHLEHSPALRHVPVIFFDGAPDKVAATREKVPDASYVTWPEVPDTLHDCCGHGT